MVEIRHTINPWVHTRVPWQIRRCILTTETHVDTERCSTFTMESVKTVRKRPTFGSPQRQTNSTFSGIVFLLLVTNQWPMSLSAVSLSAPRSGSLNLPPVPWRNYQPLLASAFFFLRKQVMWTKIRGGWEWGWGWSGGSEPQEKQMRKTWREVCLSVANVFCLLPPASARLELILSPEALLVCVRWWCYLDSGTSCLAPYQTAHAPHRPLLNSPNTCHTNMCGCFCSSGIALHFQHTLHFVRCCGGSEIKLLFITKLLINRHDKTRQKYHYGRNGGRSLLKINC